MTLSHNIRRFIGTTVLLTVAGSGAQQLSTDEQRAFVRSMCRESVR